VFPLKLINCRFKNKFSLISLNCINTLILVLVYLGGTTGSTHSNLALTSPTSGSRSVDIVRSRTQAMGFSLVFLHDIPILAVKLHKLCSLHKTLQYIYVMKYNQSIRMLRNYYENNNVSSIILHFFSEQITECLYHHSSVEHSVMAALTTLHLSCTPNRLVSMSTDLTLYRTRWLICLRQHHNLS
jgi:hypothetical protein